jgi:hypothetical protein
MSMTRRGHAGEPRAVAIPSGLDVQAGPGGAEVEGVEALAVELSAVSRITTYAVMGSESEIGVAAGDGGTLTVTQSGSRVKAAYAGDSFLSGMVDFSLVTSTFAHTVLGQTLETPCEVSFIIGPPPPDPPQRGRSRQDPWCSTARRFSSCLAGP